MRCTLICRHQNKKKIKNKATYTNTTKNMRLTSPIYKIINTRSLDINNMYLLRYISNNVKVIESNNKNTNILSSNRMSFLEVFDKVKYFLDNNPINNDTQINLETLLYNKSLDMASNKSDNFLGDRSFFSFSSPFKYIVYTGFPPPWSLKDT